MSFSEDDKETELYKSKSQIKREMHTLQRLGERLADLSADQLDQIDLPSELREAIDFAKKTQKHGARRRQMQRIGALMREIDPEPVQKAFEEIDQGRHRDTLRFKQVEKWRDDLLAGDDGLIEEVVGRFQDADRQKLRQLTRNARKEQAKNKPPKSSRALFRYLMELSKANKVSDHVKI